MVAVATTQGQALPAHPRGSFGGLFARLAAAVASASASARGLVGARATELAAALLAVVLYLPTIGFGFVFDDVSLLAPDGSPVAGGAVLPYRPVRYASYLLDFWLGGTAAIYHAHNVMLHALVAALVVAVARRLGSARTAALAGGLLVAVHPLAVEAAAYVAGRRDLLCMVFGLAAVLALLSGRLVSAVVLVVMSTAAKESGLVFLAPMMAATVAGLDGNLAAWDARVAGCDGHVAGRRKEDVDEVRACAAASRRRVRTAAAAITLAGASALALAVAYGAIGPWAPASGVVGLALPGRMAAHYLGAFIGARALAPEYPELLRFVERVQGGEVAAILAGSGATFALTIAAAAALTACLRADKRGHDRDIAFVSAWTMAVLVALSLWGGLHEPGADRHAYLLLAPAGVALATALSRLFRSGQPVVAGPSRASTMAMLPGMVVRKRRDVARAMLRSAVVVGVAVALIGSALGSRAQMQIWQSQRALWTYVCANASASPRAHANMARSFAIDGRYRDAARHMNSALAAEPDDFLLHVGRAALRCAQGRHFLARRDLRTARRLGAPAPRITDVLRDCGLTTT